MPYRMRKSGNRWCVQVKRGRRWARLKCYSAKKKARKYLAALRINVRH